MKYYTLSKFIRFKHELEIFGFEISKISKGTNLGGDVYTTTMIFFKTVPKHHLNVVDSLNLKFDNIIKNYIIDHTSNWIPPTESCIFCDTKKLYYND